LCHWDGGCNETTLTTLSIEAIECNAGKTNLTDYSMIIPHLIKIDETCQAAYAVAKAAKELLVTVHGQAEHQ
jgi:hypothetical protein